jgi:hypothetical protein
MGGVPVSRPVVPVADRPVVPPVVPVADRPGRRGKAREGQEDGVW